MNLTDDQWAVLEPLIPKTTFSKADAAKSWMETREILDGILWVLRTGSPWQNLPNRYPSPETCRRFYQQWMKEGVMRRILQTIAQDLRVRNGPDLRVHRSASVLR